MLSIPESVRDLQHLSPHAVVAPVFVQLRALSTHLRSEIDRPSFLNSGRHPARPLERRFKLSDTQDLPQGLPVDDVYPPPSPVPGHSFHIGSMDIYREMYARSVGPDRDSFWGEQSRSLRWIRPFRKVVHEEHGRV